MRFYRLHCKTGEGTSAGFEFFSTKREAEVAKQRHDIGQSEGGVTHSADMADLDVIEIEPKRAGILSALNRYASHPDNG